jgi:hypothetical protein
MSLTCFTSSSTKSHTFIPSPSNNHHSQTTHFPSHFRCIRSQFHTHFQPYSVFKPHLQTGCVLIPGVSAPNFTLVFDPTASSNLTGLPQTGCRLQAAQSAGTVVDQKIWSRDGPGEGFRMQWLIGGGSSSMNYTAYVVQLNTKVSRPIYFAAKFGTVSLLCTHLFSTNKNIWNGGLPMSTTSFTTLLSLNFVLHSPSSPTNTVYHIRLYDPPYEHNYTHPFLPHKYHHNPEYIRLWVPIHRFLSVCGLGEAPYGPSQLDLFTTHV